MSEEERQQAASIGDVFADQLAGIRRRKGWTQRRLADEMKRLGVPLHQSAVAKIEIGERDVKLEEAFAFALVLGVSPLALLAPRDDATSIAIGRRVVADLKVHLGWLRGLYSGLDLLQKDDGTFDVPFYLNERPSAEAEAIRKYPVVFELMFFAAEALGGLWEGDEDPTGMLRALLELALDRAQLALEITARSSFPEPPIRLDPSMLKARR